MLIVVVESIYALQMCTNVQKNGHVAGFVVQAADLSGQWMNAPLCLLKVALHIGVLPACSHQKTKCPR